MFGADRRQIFAECTDNPEEFLSTAVIIDCNESLRLKVGDTVYSNLYRPLPRVVRDDAGRHDLLFPGCRRKPMTFSIGTAKGIPTAMTTSTDTWSDAIPSSGR